MLQYLHQSYMKNDGGGDLINYINSYKLRNEARYIKSCEETCCKMSKKSLEYVVIVPCHLLSSFLIPSCHPTRVCRRTVQVYRRSLYFFSLREDDRILLFKSVMWIRIGLYLGSGSRSRSRCGF